MSISRISSIWSWIIGRFIGGNIGRRGIGDGCIWNSAIGGRAIWGRAIGGRAIGGRAIGGRGLRSMERNRTKWPSSLAIGVLVVYLLIRTCSHTWNIPSIAAPKSTKTLWSVWWPVDHWVSRIPTYIHAGSITPLSTKHYSIRKHGKYGWRNMDVN